MSVLGSGYLDGWEERQRSPVEAMPTPFPILNRVCGDDGGGVGIARGWFTTIGGNPGHGKSLVALNMAASAVLTGLDVCYVTLEMSDHQLATRVYSILTKIPVKELERGTRFDPSDLRKRLADLLLKSSSGARQPSLYVNQTPLVSVADVLKYMHDQYDDWGCRVFFVDYLQLVGTGNEDHISAATTEIATTVRSFANTTRSVVVGLSQYNRRTSADKTGKPTAQSLYGGMSLEANSDLVLLLDHSRYERSETNPAVARTWLVVGKNRHGMQIEIPIRWDYRTLTCSEADEALVGQWP